MGERCSRDSTSTRRHPHRDSPNARGPHGAGRTRKPTGSEPSAPARVLEPHLGRGGGRPPSTDPVTVRAGPRNRGAGHTKAPRAEYSEVPLRGAHGDVSRSGRGERDDRMSSTVECCLVRLDRWSCSYAGSARSSSRDRSEHHNAWERKAAASIANEEELDSAAPKPKEWTRRASNWGSVGVHGHRRHARAGPSNGRPDDIAAGPKTAKKKGDRAGSKRARVGCRPGEARGDRMPDQLSQ